MSIRDFLRRCLGRCPSPQSPVPTPLSSDVLAPPVFEAVAAGLTRDIGCRQRFLECLRRIERQLAAEADVAGDRAYPEWSTLRMAAGDLRRSRELREAAQRGEVRRG